MIEKTAFYLKNMNGIEYWNSLPKPSKEVDVKAQPGDLVIEIDGILYLIQRTNEANNVVCFRVNESYGTLLASFLMLREWLIKQDIQYIRVEGNTKRYKFLAKLKLGEGYNVLQDTNNTERNVFYIKLY